MAIINKVEKAGIVSMLLMSAVAAKAGMMTNPMTNPDRTTNLTEIASKNGAAALKTISLQSAQQASVPTVHNQRLDDLFRKYASNEEEVNLVNSIVKDFYNNQGTFLASARIQHEIDRQLLYTLFDEDTKTLSRINPELAEKIQNMGHENFYDSVSLKADSIINWLENEYSPIVLQYLDFGHKPTFDEVSERLEYIAENIVNLTKDDKLLYHVGIGDFNSKYKGPRDDRYMSELAAFKIFMIDYIMFEKALEKGKIGFGLNIKYLMRETVRPRKY